jgi:type II secretory pathway component PulF
LRWAADTAEAKREPVSLALTATGEFSNEVMVRWKNGERTGQLDAVFAQLSRSSAARVEARLKALAEWGPRLIYGLVCVYVVAQILRGATAVSAARFGGMN